MRETSFSASLRGGTATPSTPIRTTSSMERSSVRKEPSWRAYASSGSSCTEQVVMNPRRPRFTPARGTWCAAAREETVSMVPSPPKVTSMLHRTMACSRASGVSMTQDPSPVAGKLAAHDAQRFPQSRFFRQRDQADYLGRIHAGKHTAFSRAAQLVNHGRGKDSFRASLSIKFQFLFLFCYTRL